MASFGIDFGQKVDLTASIRNILRNYPEGTAVLKELVQNADDAGARKIIFTLDLRQHGTSMLASPSLSAFQGPALTVFNDETFSDSDFESIQRIGDSLKKVSDSAKIGRFGIGFNAVYHWTDLPSFISSKYLVMLDPQANFLPNVNPSNPGKMVDFIGNPSVIKEYRDQFAPYSVDWSKPFAGTLFRLPLRTQELSKDSKLSKRVLTAEEAREIMNSMINEASSMLLFLKSVERIEICVWEPNSSSPNVLFQTHIANSSRDLISKRQLVTNFSDAEKKDNLGNNKVFVADYSLDISCVSQTSKYLEKWDVCNQFGGGIASTISNDENNVLLKLIPWGGVAALLERKFEKDSGSVFQSNESTNGLAYCFLPLPIETGLPVMVNAFFELSSNRRDIWQKGNDMTGDGKTRGEWNLALMTDVIAPCYVRILARAKRFFNFNFEGAFQKLWPRVDISPPWQQVTLSVVKLVQNERLLFSNLSLNLSQGPNLGILNVFKGALGQGSIEDQWIPCKNAIIFPIQHAGVIMEEDDNKILSSLLIVKGKQSLVECSKHIRAGLIECGVYSAIVKPEFVRSVMKEIRWNSFAEFSSVVDFKKVYSNLLSILPASVDVKVILRFCFSDYVGDFSAKKYNSFNSELDGLLVLPVVPGGFESENQNCDIVGCLRFFSDKQINMLSNLVEMGVSESLALHALCSTNFNFNSVCDSIATRPLSQLNQSNIEVIKRTVHGNCLFFLCNDDSEFDLFSVSKYSLIDRAQVEPKEWKILCSAQCQQFSNVKLFSSRYIADVLGNILPESCFVSESLFKGVKMKDIECWSSLRAFLTNFFRYLSTHSDAIPVIAEKVALIPVTCNEETVLYPLSKMSLLVVFPSDAANNSKLNFSALSDLLRALGFRILDNSVVFPSINLEIGTISNLMPLKFWEYVYSIDNFKSVIDALDVLSRNFSKLSLWQEYFLKNSSAEMREILKKYFAEYSNAQNPLSRNDIQVLRKLPIYKCFSSELYIALSSDGDDDFNQYCILPNDFQIESAIIPSNFLQYLDLKECQLLVLLGVSSISITNFYKEYFLPSAQENYTQHKEAYISTVSKMITDLSSLSLEDKYFVNALRYCNFVPVAVNDSSNFLSLRKPSDLYDPEQSELLSLLPLSSFPDGELHRKDVLVYLRGIGLKTALDWSAVIECAQSIELEFSKGKFEDFDPSRASNLLKFLNANPQLFSSKTVNVEPSGKPTVEARRSSLFGFSSLVSIFNIVTGTSDADENQKNKADEENKYISKLCSISWLPIDQDVRNDCLPVLQPLRLVSSPVQSRPYSDAVFCSATKYLCKEYVSPLLSDIFGWTLPLTGTSIAIQLKELIASYEIASQIVSSTDVQSLQKMKENMSFIVHQLYGKLNDSENEFINISSILESSNWIWMGDCFVDTSRIAHKVTVNASPYLYQLPVDYLVYKKLFNAFKIKEIFSARDYVGVLRVMFEEQGKSGAKLQDARLDIAISLATLLANDCNDLKNQSVYLPDQMGFLRKTDLLVNDDVPWLFGPEYASVRSGKNIIHTSISSAVAEKFGVQSLRLVLISKNLDNNIFSSETLSPQIEAFGQAESITSRLKTILDLYPEGNPIYSELIQNADDAGAKSMKILLDENIYGTESLLNPKMAALQGPALLFFNDATFSENDYKSLCRIGQGSKLDKLATTGRFGLGFNSTYHLTDCPSFVSGENLVIFDPHCAYAPGATLSQPGLKVKFVVNDNHLVETFADQFAPYLIFGNDLRKKFNGTLFRFPLRTANQARQSEISKRSYTTADIHSSMENLIENLGNYLTFLRNLRCIEVYHCYEGSKEPVLVHRLTSSVSGVETVNDQTLFKYFNKQDPLAISDASRDNFYNKLLLTPESKLPQLYYRMLITSEIYKVNVQNNHSEAVRNIKVDYLIASGILGGNARKLACDESTRHLKLVPLGCVAACLSKVDVDLSDNFETMTLFPPVNGIVYCFLPLPVNTSLPVHVNAYFELSSNRRDIWMGDDTSGEAKLRSDWNIFIVGDVLAPLYSKLIKKLSMMYINKQSNLEDKNSLLKFLPCPLPHSDIWRALGWNTLPLIKDDCLLMFTKLGNKYLNLGQSILLIEYKEANNDVIDKVKAGRIQNLLSLPEVKNVDTIKNYSHIMESSENTARLEALLLQCQIPVVNVGLTVGKVLISSNVISGYICPSYLRGFFSSSVFHLSVEDAIFLFQYCSKDIERNYRELFGLKFLPLEDGSLATLKEKNMNSGNYYIVSDLERRILKKYCGNMIVCTYDILGGRLTECLKDPLFSEVCNVQSLKCEDMCKLLLYSIPSDWFVDPKGGTPRESWKLKSIIDISNVFSSDWLTDLWTYIIDKKCLNMFVDIVPLIPICQPKGMQIGCYLARVSEKIPVLALKSNSLRSTEELISTDIVEAFSDIGLYLFDPSIIGRVSYSEDVHRVLCKATPESLLDSLCTVCSSSEYLNCADKMNQWSSICRLSLRAYILDEIIARVEHLTIDEAGALLSLPIWSFHDGMPEPNFRKITMDEVVAKKVILPPEGIDVLFLNNKYLSVRSQSDFALYNMLHIVSCTAAEFYICDIIPQYSLKNIKEGCTADTKLLYAQISVDILKRLSQLEIEDSNIIDILSSTPFVLNCENCLFCPMSLYDPESTSKMLDLKHLLPNSMFPSANTYKDSLFLASLRKLGLRTVLDSAGVLKIAKSIANDFEKLPKSESMSVGNVEVVINKATRLLRYLEVNIESVLEEVDPVKLKEYQEFLKVGSEGKNENENSGLDGGDWGRQFRSISWIPTFTSPPLVDRELYSLLPWPNSVHSFPAGCALQTSNVDNVWLTSQVYKVSLLEIKSSLLSLVLGMNNRKFPGRVLVLQLMNIHQLIINENSNGILTERKGRLIEKEIMRIYEGLEVALKNESMQEINSWLNILVGKPVFWTRICDGFGFVDCSRVAFQPLSRIVNIEPYLFTVTPEFTRFSGLFKAIGVRDSFTPADIVDIFKQLKLQYGENHISLSETEMCVGLLGILAQLLESSNAESKLDIGETSVSGKVSLQSIGTIYIPDQNNILAFSSSLTFNDAQWTKRTPSLLSQHKNVRFVHPLVDIKTAALLGCKSYREQLFAGHSVACPSVHIIKNLINDDTMDDLIKDLITVADSTGCNGIHLVYDERNHPTESLLHPDLSDTQGTALLCYMEGAVLNGEGIAKLLSIPIVTEITPGVPSTSQEDYVKKLIARYPKCGKGLASAFTITDCLQILSGGHLYVYDPCGLYLLDANELTSEVKHKPSKGQKCALSATSSSQEQGSALARFPDQFVPFLSLPFQSIHDQLSCEKGSDGCPKIPYLNGIVIRMPLRKAASSLNSIIPTLSNMKSLANNYFGMVEGSIIFANSLIFATCKHCLINESDDNYAFINDFEINLVSPPQSRLQRIRLMSDKTWKPVGVVGSFFAKAYTPLEVSYDISTSVKIVINGEIEPFLRFDGFMKLPEVAKISESAKVSSTCLPMNNTWRLNCILGFGRGREEAMKAVYRNMRLIPIVSAAVLISGSLLNASAEVPPFTGYYYSLGGICGVSGLPIHIEGPFLQDFPKREFALPVDACLLTTPRSASLTGWFSSQSMDDTPITGIVRKGSVSGVGNVLSSEEIKNWNSCLINGVIRVLLPKCLETLRDNVFRYLPNENLLFLRKLVNFYRFWPYLSRCRLSTRQYLVKSEVHSWLSGFKFFLMKSGYESLDKLIVLPNKHLSEVATQYFCESMPVSFCPKLLVDEMTEQIGEKCKVLTPHRLREALKRDSSKHTSFLQAHKEIVFELFKFCIDDMINRDSSNASGLRYLYKELIGVPLLLTANNSLVPFPSNVRDRLVVAPAGLHHLLSTFKNNFVSVQQTNLSSLFNDSIFLETLYLSKINVSVLSDLINNLFSSALKRCGAVLWNPEFDNYLNPLLIYALWLEILGKSDFSGLDKVSDWPLLPVCSGDSAVLISPAIMPLLFYVNPCSANEDTLFKFERDYALKGNLEVSSIGAIEMSSSRTNTWEWSSKQAFVDTLPLVESSVSAVDTSPRPIAPEISEQPPSAALLTAEENIESMPVISSNIMSIIKAVGLPILDNRFFRTVPLVLRSNSINVPVGRRLLDSLFEIHRGNVTVYSFNGETVTGVKPLVNFETLTVAQRSELLREIYNAHRTTPFTQNDINKLKSLRIFSAIDGESTRAVSVEEASSVFWTSNTRDLEGLMFVGGSDSVLGILNNDHGPLLLINDSSLLDVYDLIGVAELNAINAVKRFTIPSLLNMDEAKRLKVIGKLAMRWSTFSSDAEIVSALKNIAFIPGWCSDVKSGVYGEIDFSLGVRKADELLVWGNPALAQVLSGQKQYLYFPPPCMGDPDCQRSEIDHNYWKVMLLDLGGVLELNKDKFFRIVSDFDFESNKIIIERNLNSKLDCLVVNGDVYDNAIIMLHKRCTQFLEYIKVDDRSASFLDANLARKIGSLRFVPVQLPISIEQGGFVNYQMALVKMNQTLSYHSTCLGFSVYPILPESISFPSYFFSTLGVMSDPPTEVVLRHLLNIIGNSVFSVEQNDEVVLDRWNCEKSSIKDTFIAIFQYLFDHWKDIALTVRNRLKTLSVIPINNVLMKPSRLFFRLTEDLSPFMYEIPRYLGSAEGFLMECMGVRESPMLSDYQMFLFELAQECIDSPLNPNELRAVLTILRILSDSSNTVEQSTAKIELFVPDESAILRPIKACVINDNIWLKSKAAKGLYNLGLHILHPRVMQQFVSKFDISYLSHVVTERIVTFQSSDSSDILNKYKILFENNGLLIFALLSLLTKFSMEVNNITVKAMRTVSESYISGKLANVVLKFVSSLETNFVLKDLRNSSAEVIVCKNLPLYFVDTSSGSGKIFMYVCLSSISDVVSIETSISLCLCELFQLDKSVAGSLACIIGFCINGKNKESNTEEISKLLSLFQMGVDENSVLEKQRGVPGEKLLDVDKNRLEVSPYHNFRIGDSLAYSTSQDSFDVEYLRYGRILGTTTNDNALDIIQVNVKINETEAKWFPATDLHVFKSARLSGKKENDKSNMSSVSSKGKSDMKLGVASENKVMEMPTSSSPSNLNQDVSGAILALMNRAGIPVSLDSKEMINQIVNLEGIRKRTDMQLNSLRAENEELKLTLQSSKNLLKCEICLANDIQNVLIPCGHTLCSSCSEKLNAKCPFCRRHVQSKVKLFLNNSEKM